ncbi:MAG: Bax inhibitor-1/YccA family protein [Verrucomicrobiota bacterium]
MRTGNPTLSNETFRLDSAGGQTMTVGGTVNKTALLLFGVIATAAISWHRTATATDPSALLGYILIGGIGGFVVALATVFRKEWAPVTAPIYAALEGLFLGVISAFFEQMYPGIVFQAVILTFGTLASLLVAYRSGLIKATENFKLGVAAATGAIFMIYLVGFIMSFFGSGIPYIHESGTIGIAFSLFVVVIAALNLVLDFDFIEQGADQGAPKYMEWYAAFGLLVTLIWLYLEILRLLAKLRSR